MLEQYLCILEKKNLQWCSDCFVLCKTLKVLSHPGEVIWQWSHVSWNSVMSLLIQVTVSVSVSV